MIDVINLQKSFGDKEILKGINVTINKGDIVAVLGPSGSGKSTFLRCLNCMEDPTGGSIIFNGVDIADMKVDINQHRRHMGMVFQHFNLYNNKTVLQNVMMAPAYLRCKDIDKAKKKNRMIKFKNMFRGSDKKEELIPITETKEQIKKEVMHILDIQMKDNVKASILQADGTYTKPDKRGKMLVNSQEYFCREATERAEKPKEQENSRVFVPAEPVE